MGYNALNHSFQEHDPELLKIPARNFKSDAKNQTTITKSRRNGVMILAMHRSGTSMLSGLLVEGFGYKVGSPLIPAGPANPKGFFELLPVVLQNDEFFKKQSVQRNAGVVKFDNQKALSQYKSGTVEFIRGKKALTFLNNPKNVPYLQKDPRMCITLPTWLALLKDKGKNSRKEPAILFTFRHPLQVSMSLKKREGNFGLEHALRLWCQYNMRAIQNSQGQCRITTSNKAILQNPWLEVTRISHELTTKCGVPRPPKRLSQDVVNEFVNLELQQQTRNGQDDENRTVLFEFNNGDCKAYEYDSQYKHNHPRYKRELNMYKTAMQIYCDLENGKAYEMDYQWPEL